jgi:hypothetical protein
MTNNHNDHHQLLQIYNGDLVLSQNAQSRWGEMLSPIQALAGADHHHHPPQQQQQQVVKRRKTKCRGNSKLQHFKRKFRARGLTEDEIARLTFERNQKIYEQVLSNETTAIDEQPKE